MQVKKLKLECLKQGKNIHVVLPSSPEQFETNQSRESGVMISHTNRQTEIEPLSISIPRHCKLVFNFARTIQETIILISKQKTIIFN